MSQAESDIHISSEIITRSNCIDIGHLISLTYGDKGDKLNGYVLPSLKFYKEWFRKPDLKRKNEIQNHLKSLGYTQPDFSNIGYQFMKTNGLLDDIDWHWTFDIMEWAALEKKSTFGIDDWPSILKRMNAKSPIDTRGKTGNEAI